MADQVVQLPAEATDPGALSDLAGFAHAETRPAPRHRANRSCRDKGLRVGRHNGCDQRHIQSRLSPGDRVAHHRTRLARSRLPVPGLVAGERLLRLHADTACLQTTQACWSIPTAQGIQQKRPQSVVQWPRDQRRKRPPDWHFLSRLRHCRAQTGLTRRLSTGRHDAPGFSRRRHDDERQSGRASGPAAARALTPEHMAPEGSVRPRAIR